MRGRERGSGTVDGRMKDRDTRITETPGVSHPSVRHRERLLDRELRGGRSSQPRTFWFSVRVGPGSPQTSGSAETRSQEKTPRGGYPCSVQERTAEGSMRGWGRHVSDFLQPSSLSTGRSETSARESHRRRERRPETCLRRGSPRGRGGVAVSPGEVPRFRGGPDRE